MEMQFSHGNAIFPNLLPKTECDTKFLETQSKCGILSKAFLFSALNINLRTGCISLVLHFYVGNFHCMLLPILINVEQFWFIPKHHAVMVCVKLHMTDYELYRVHAACTKKVHLSF
jgi:hypothetical protein